MPSLSELGDLLDSFLDWKKEKLLRLMRLSCVMRTTHFSGLEGRNGKASSRFIPIAFVFFICLLFLQMRTSSVIPQSFLPPESVKLGRFVVNLDEPQQEYLDPLIDEPARQAEAVKKPQLHYEEVRQTESDAGFAAMLTQLVSASRSRRKQVLTRVQADRITTYQLPNSGSWFREAVKLEKTLGYHAMLDAQIFEGAAGSQDTAVKIDMPITASLAAAGVVAPLGESLDTSVGGHNHHHLQLQRHYVASEEQICAIQYHRVRFSWFSSRDIDKASLDKDNRWKNYWTVRGHDTDVDDVIEVEMEDNLDLEGDWESNSVGDDQIFSSK
ncbi:hypothetical protein BX600DRAFT_533166 [Xylariales sp. PMI_506]|nr:hypothetical protein BX600DRAFT_533166 [Xylariales sp. PMI_506]